MAKWGRERKEKKLQFVIETCACRKELKRERTC